MASLTWSCPVPQCVVRDREQPGLCPVHLVPLEQPRAAEAPVSPALSLALRFPWGVTDVPTDDLVLGREAVAFQGGPIRNYGQISRRHARVFWRDGRLLVEDLGSANGTYVDGTEVKPGDEVELRPGSRLRLALDVDVQVVTLNEFGEPV